MFENIIKQVNEQENEEENGQEFTPYIHPSRKLKEISFTSLVMGILLAAIFCAANTYLGLRVGMTVSASIPTAVIAIGVMRAIKRKDSILESNMIQTIGSVGEAIAAGAIFTLPVFFIWEETFSHEIPVLGMFLIAISGGVLGILFMIPLRKTHVVKDHNTLPYPEGTACSKVLLAGEEKTTGARKLFVGMGVAAVIRFMEGGLNLITDTISIKITQLRTEFNIAVEPALISVGYICGFRVSSYLFAGGIFAWLALIPAVVILGVEAVIFPGTNTVAEIYQTGGASAIWSDYIRYIGAGAVAIGGFFSLAKNARAILAAFVKSMRGIKETEPEEKTRANADIWRPLILLGIIAAVVMIAFCKSIPVDIIGTALIVVFGFFFAAVSSRMAGLVGTSHTPISGMTIGTLLISTLILKASGHTGLSAMLGAISIGSIVCITSAVAGDTSQNLKTGFLLGATPRSQQIGQLIGVAASAAVVCCTLFLLDRAWGFGSPKVPAPQATMMQMIVEGVIGNKIPWTLVAIGAFIAVVVEILGKQSLPFAIGLYLPLNLSAGMMLGGALRLWHDKRKRPSKEVREADISTGILRCSGLIAGEGIIGILLAVLAVIPLGKQNALSYLESFGDTFTFGIAGSVIACIGIFYFISKQTKRIQSGGDQVKQKIL